MCVWALPAADQAVQGTSAATQSPTLNLQLVFSSTLAELAVNSSAEVPVLRDAATQRLAAMLHWHVKHAAFQLWLLAGGQDILSALHPQAKSDQTLALAPNTASVPQPAAGIRSTSQHDSYQGHQVRPSADIHSMQDCLPMHLSSVAWNFKPGTTKDWLQSKPMSYTIQINCRQKCAYWQCCSPAS